MNGLPPGYQIEQIKRLFDSINGAPPLKAGRPPCNLVEAARVIGRAKAKGERKQIERQPAVLRCREAKGLQLLGPVAVGQKLFWRNIMKKWTSGTSKANQEIKRVYGLKGKETWMPTLVEFSDLNLASLDAPELIPAGSTWRDEEPEIERFTCNETLTYRDGPVPWKQGAEKFNRIKGGAK